MDKEKAVIVRVIPDEWAPIDDYGRRAEVIINNSPAFRRQIYSSLMEAAINFINLQVFDDLKAIMEGGDYQSGWECLTKFYKAVSPEFYQIFENAGYENNAEARAEHIDYVLRTKISVFKRSDSELYGADIIRSLSKHYPDRKPTPVWYTNDLGEKIRTENPVVISSMYYMLLDKFGTDMSSQSLPKLSLFGTPAKLSKGQRYRAFNRDQGNRNTGETEGRAQVSQTGGQETVKLLSGANSSVLSKKMQKRIIRAHDPFNIKQIIKPDEYATNRSVQMGINTLSDTGYTLRRENEYDLN